MTDLIRPYPYLSSLYLKWALSPDLLVSNYATWLLPDPYQLNYSHRAQEIIQFIAQTTSSTCKTDDQVGFLKLCSLEGM